MKDKYSITKKWNNKIEEMKKKTELKYTILLKKKKERVEADWEYQISKLERKKNSEIKKKEEQYTRKMNNEIRELEWKPKRVYKSDAPKIKPLDFALKIAQENARLRDTNADWYGYCISCDKWCSWAELAWGHRYPRGLKWVALELENINAQCHSCNNATGPLGNVELKEKTNAHYDENLDKKYWPGTADKLKKKVSDYFHGKSEHYDLDMIIPQLIEENERLWKTKSFYAPAKKWHDIWTKYKNRT